MSFRITANQDAIHGKVRVSASKSIANRLLIIRALCGSGGRIDNMSTAADTQLLRSLLTQKTNVFDAQDAGTTFRFLMAYLSIQEGEWFLTGTKRLLERPHEVLVSALKELGADIQSIQADGQSGFRLKGRKLRGGVIRVDVSESSQFVSALMLIGPYLEGGVQIHLSADPVSDAYINMTLNLMRNCGAEVERDGGIIKTGMAPYSMQDLRVEGDWSSAAFWYELVALSGKSELLIEDLQENSIQGDAAIVQIMKNFGVSTEFLPEGVLLRKNNHVVLSDHFEYNFRQTPDLFPSLLALCAGLKIFAKFSGLQTLNLKESNRVLAMSEALSALGMEVNYQKENDLLTMIPGTFKKDSVVLDVHQDHRIAMALAPLSKINGSVLLSNARVVNKSYPEFWEQLKQLGFRLDSPF